MSRIVKRIFLVLLAVAGVVLLALAFRPAPVVVETAIVSRGPLQVTLEEDGETRAHDRFTLAAPIAGRLSRIEFHEGDTVGPEDTLATLSPLPADARETAEIRARIEAAEARRREAQEQLASRENDHAQAVRDAERARLLAQDRIVARQVLEQAESRETGAAKDVEAAGFRVRSAQADLEREKAGLISLEAAQAQNANLVALRPPVRSRILRILERSERVVPFGTPIVILSNPAKLEIVADLLSTDAVKVQTGMPVIIENWGGPQSLRGRVRLVEPYGFTRVSALGIEEQRANVIIDFVDPPANLGDGYRVDVRIILWEQPSVLKVPASALFRVGARWNIFVMEAGQARLIPVGIAHRNADEVELTSGLNAGARVILHPPGDLKAGTRVVVRGS